MHSQSLKELPGKSLWSVVLAKYTGQSWQSTTHVFWVRCKAPRSVHQVPSRANRHCQLNETKLRQEFRETYLRVGSELKTCGKAHFTLRATSSGACWRHLKQDTEVAQKVTEYIHFTKNSLPLRWISQVLIARRPWAYTNLKPPVTTKFPKLKQKPLITVP